MNLAEHVSAAFAPIPEENGLLVPTSTLYPSNGNVVVYVTGGKRSCVVSDRGDALRNARAHGVDIPNVDIWLRHILKNSYLHSGNGAITSGKIKLGEVLAGIALVARAASDAVRYAIENYKRPEASVYDRTYDVLQRRFGAPNIPRQTNIAGASNRNYHFDFAAPVGKRMLLIDTALPNPSSVNAKAVAHMDIGAVKENPPLHAIVYDKSAAWDASDINLLQSVAQLLPLATLHKELGRYESLH
jgi:hypothetical protein